MSSILLRANMRYNVSYRFLQLFTEYPLSELWNSKIGYLPFSKTSMTSLWHCNLLADLTIVIVIEFINLTHNTHIMFPWHVPCRMDIECGMCPYESDILTLSIFRLYLFAISTGRNFVLPHQTSTHVAVRWEMPHCAVGRTDEHSYRVKQSLVPLFPAHVCQCVFVEGVIPRLESGVVPCHWNPRLQATVSDVHVCISTDGDQCSRDSSRTGQTYM